MRQLSNPILLAVALIKQGPTHLERLEAFLETMSAEDRITLSLYCNQHDIASPMIVHFNYFSQRWYKDLTHVVYDW